MGKKKSTKSLWVYISILIKVKHLLTLWPRNSTPNYLPKINESIYPQEDEYKKVHGHFIHISQKVGRNVRQQENGKTNVIYSSSGILALNKKEWTAIFTTWLDLRDTTLNERIQTQKNIAWFPLYEFLQQANEVIASRREVDWERVSEDFLRLWRCAISG